MYLCVYIYIYKDGMRPLHFAALTAELPVVEVTMS